MKDFKLNPEDFPELQAIISKNTSNYFIGRAFRAPSNADYLPLAKIEDLFTNNHRMLIELTQQLLKKGKPHQAKGVWQRHGLFEFAPIELNKEMERILYNPAHDLQPEDKFAPSPSTEDALHLPKEVQVRFIGTEQDVGHLRQLLGKPFVGMDCEWRPTMTKLDLMRPALLQLSDQSNAFLIDLVALANSVVLDQMLCEIFTHKETVCIGFGFQSDMDVLGRYLPRMQFFKNFAQFIDLQKYYEHVCH